MADPQVKIIIQSLEGFTARTLQRLVLKVHENLVINTPVDTGWARANWVPNIGNPFAGLAGTKKEAEQGTLDESLAALGLAQVASQYDLTQGPVHITNNVPYIRVLNEGSSEQAPAGFVETSVDEAVNTVTGS